MLWAITSYFNPAGYNTRLANYRAFRARLKVPLVTVEASFDGRVQLRAGDAEILVQRTARDVLWQKERLLNVALGFLPPECQEVAWIDCDVVFATDDWVARARAALGTHSLVQLFSERCDLDRETTADPSKWHAVDSGVWSVASKLAAGQAAPRDLYDANAPFVRRTTVGLAWAARRDVLDRNGLYDACILGSGDRVMLCAAIGEFDYGARCLAMNARQEEHYRRWGASFSAAIGARVCSIDGRLFHLWHGDLSDRRYAERHQDLQRFRFDPFTDIAVDGDGCWSWNTGKVGMHDYVRRYFASRKEDGTAPTASRIRPDGHG